MRELERLIHRAVSGRDPYALGAVPSDPDPRDFTAPPQAFAPSAPDVVVTPGTGQVAVYNQQGGTCTGYATAAVLSHLEYAETSKRVAFDGSELHHRVVKSYGNGAMPRDVLEDVRTRGASAMDAPTHTSLRGIEGYAWISERDPETILTALTRGPLLLALWIGDAFTHAWLNRSREYVGTGRPADGYHAVTIVGADRARGVTIQNSWGESGGFGIGIAAGGFINVSWDYLAAHAGEVWSVADRANGLLEGYIKNHVQEGDATGIRLVKRADRPAVYMLVGRGRWWVQSQAALDAMGLRGKPIYNLAASDEVWSYPVIGPDAPLAQRA